MNDSPADKCPTQSTDTAGAASSPASEAAIRVTTGSRLHFGLLDTSAPFGGAGVMVEDPATQVALEPDYRFVCEDVATSRVRAIAHRVSDRLGLEGLPPCRVTVLGRPPSHSGLGSGTQLAMAVAEALCRFVDAELEPDELARAIAGRGQRSAVGIHGYFHGGLIYESGELADELNPMRRRVLLPDSWRVAVFQPPATSQVSGDLERQKFAQLAEVDDATRGELRSMIEQAMVPAGEQANYEAFVSAVESYNHRSGLLFESVQGGPYNGPAITDLIQALTARGARGVGQSSWGSSVFAWFESSASATHFLENLPAEFARGWITKPRNRGRLIQ